VDDRRHHLRRLAALLIGSFQIIGGLAAIIDDDFYVVTRNYAFNLDITAWGWIHLLIGVLLVATALGLSQAHTWARVTAIVLTIVSAIANFLFIPRLPVLVDPRDRPRRLGHLGTDPRRRLRRFPPFS
jgi:hypothetical protein